MIDSACARARMRDPSAADGEVQVGVNDVAAVVSDLTGVPIGGMLSDVSKMASRLEQILAERVVGQDAALARCASQARAYLAGTIRSASAGRRVDVLRPVRCGQDGDGAMRLRTRCSAAGY